MGVLVGVFVGFGVGVMVGVGVGCRMTMGKNTGAAGIRVCVGVAVCVGVPKGVCVDVGVGETVVSEVRKRIATSSPYAASSYHTLPSKLVYVRPVSYGPIASIGMGPV